MQKDIDNLLQRKSDLLVNNRQSLSNSETNEGLRDQRTIM